MPRSSQRPRRILRRVIFILVIGLTVLVAAPFLLMALNYAMVVTGAHDDEAVAVLPGDAEAIIVRRRPIWHPFLGNEFYRTLIVRRGNDEILRAELAVDTGGYPEMQLYELEPGTLLLIHVSGCERIDRARASVQTIFSTAQSNKMSGSRLIGTFNEDEQRRLRFFAAPAHNPLYAPHSLRACL
jgi:hypothetical protein